MKFSVLMSIYHKEKVDYFNRAMQSIWQEQSVKPNEIVLVEDGKLTNELYTSIYKWQKKLGNILKTVPLKNNIGLGNALNIGLNECSYNIVARMDTDDIALPYRFEKQLEYLNKHPKVDVLSSWVSEFDKEENKIVSYRKVPHTHQQILQFAKTRNPLNHPSVMYKKKAVCAAGNYQNMIGFEDYYLWVRMLLQGCKMANIQEPLVKMRAGYQIIERRGGLTYIKNEILFQNRLRELGFIGNKQFTKNILIRTIVRITPKSLRAKVYKLIRQKD